MSGNTQDGRRHAASIFGSLHAIRYMFAVGPPMSEITPVKPGVLSRIRSISRRIEPSERFWMMRPFVLGDRAERAAAEAAAHDRHREPDHFPGRDLCVAVGGMRRARVGKIVDGVHLGGGERDRRRVQPQIAVAMALDERPCIAGIALPVQHARGAGIGFAVLLHLLARRQPDHDIAAAARRTLVGGVEIVRMQLRVIVRHTAKQRRAAN